MRSEEISDILTKKGIAKLKKGQILIFDNKGEKLELKITKIDVKNSKVWARRVVTYREDEIVIAGKKNIFGRAKRQTIKEYNDRKSKS